MQQLRAKSQNTLETILRKLNYEARSRAKDKEDYVERLIHITNAMEAHIEADAKAFEVLGGQLIEVNKDVKSLLASRSFLRGTWFTIVIGATLVGTIAGLFVAWYK